MITREIPFKGLEGLQVAWLVVEKNEVVACSNIQTKNKTNVCKQRLAIRLHLSMSLYRRHANKLNVYEQKKKNQMQSKFQIRLDCGEKKKNFSLFWLPYHWSSLACVLLQVCVFFQRLTIPSGCPASFAELLRTCWKTEPRVSGAAGCVGISLTRARPHGDR